MKYLLLKDRRRRMMFHLYERSRNVLLAVVQNLSLSATVRMQAYRTLIYLPRDSSITRIRNRCTLTGRSRGIYRQFGLSRLMFRKLAWEGKLRGVKKASWLFLIKTYLYIPMNFLSNRLTAIRNGKAAQLEQIIFTRPQGSRPKNIFAILTILRKRGRIRAFTFKERLVSGKLKTQYVIHLKYDSVGKSVIDSLFRVSKPSRRVYLSSSVLWQPQTTTGFFVLSTTYGILTDSEARRYNVGGEVLFGVT